jgi:hypothetical protein
MGNCNLPKRLLAIAGRAALHSALPCFIPFAENSLLIGKKHRASFMIPEVSFSQSMAGLTAQVRAIRRWADKTPILARLDRPPPVI